MIKCKTTLKDEESGMILFEAGKQYPIKARSIGQFCLIADDGEQYWFNKPVDEKEDCIANQVFDLGKH